GGAEAEAAGAQAGLGGGAVVLETVALGEGLGEQLGALAEGAVEPGAETLRVVDESLVGLLVDEQTNGRTTAGHGPPPRFAGYSKGESWPFSSPRLLYERLQLHPAPQSVTVRLFLRLVAPRRGNHRRISHCHSG